MNVEERQSSHDVNLDADEDSNKNTSTLLQQETSESRKESIYIKSKNHKLKVICVITLVAVIVLGVVLGIKLSESNKFIHLKRSTGHVRVLRLGKTPSQRSQYSRISATEEELFNKYSDSIFKGKILDIQNIEIIFGLSDNPQDESESYEAIVTVKIDEILLGNEKAGDVVKIKVHSPIGILADMWIEDREEYYSMRVGAEGVFMASKYNENDCWEELDGRLYLKDICDYGLWSESCAIIQNDNGYFFRGDSPILWYDTFDDVKKYVLEMINPVNKAHP